MSLLHPVILVRPQLEENIGFVARAMGNFGFQDLRIVAPVVKSWPSLKAEKVACSAQSILSAARVYDCVSKSVEDLSFLFAFSARSRVLNKPFIVPSEIDILHDKVGFVFGCESSGLSNDELMLADKVVYIPTSRDCSSINLSHAVAIMCYEVSCRRRLTAVNCVKEEESVSKHDLVLMYEYLESELDKRGFFRVSEKRKTMVHSIRTMLGRIEFTRRELQTMYGMIRALSNSANNSNQK